MTVTNFQEVFLTLLGVHVGSDDDEFTTCKEILESSGQQLGTTVDEELEMAVSISDSFQVCPLITKSFNVLLASIFDCLIAHRDSQAIHYYGSYHG